MFNDKKVKTSLIRHKNRQKSRSKVIGYIIVRSKA